jgi:hypothetical protein
MKAVLEYLASSLYEGSLEGPESFDTYVDSKYCTKYCTCKCM